MPLVKWYTQPLPAPPTEPKNFSSYYLYDTDTHKLVRIRLELGRSTNSPTNGETNIGYNADRAVGFSKASLTSPSKGGKWSVNDKFELSYNGTPLAGPPPEPGFRDYDVTIVTSSTGVKSFSGFHPGNATTNDPKLPPGIAEDHLTLLAQDAMIKAPSSFISLSKSNASIDELATAIKDQVVRVLGAKDFSEVNEGSIKTKLVEQAKTIAGTASSDSVKATEKVLVSAEKAESVITAEITDGQTVPTEKLETAVTDLVQATTDAQSSIGGEKVEQALVQIDSAQQAVTTAIKESSTVKDPTVTSQLDDAEQSLNVAKVQATEVEEVQAQYKGQTGADSVEQYDDSLSSV